MNFLKLPPPLHLHLLLNHNHRSLSFHPHTHRNRTFTLPSFFRQKSTSPKRIISSILQTGDGVTSDSDSCSTEHDNLSSVVRIVAVVGEGALSPLKSASWLDVMIHTAERLKWVDDQYDMLVFTDNISDSNQNLQRELTTSNILLVVSVTNPEPVEWIQRYSQKIPNVVCFDSSPALQNKLGGSLVNKKTKETAKTISESWIRYNSDDIRFCLLLIINSYIKPVPILKNLRAQGFSTLNCMVKNCGIQVLNCLLDPNCRKALQCLNECSPVDQVCNYQCIASYESPILEEFSLCVLQKHNCLDLDAKIPEKPFVPPMVKFQGEPLSHEIAEDLFVGWLGKMEWSWRVVAGQNPAYDQFPCQYQLFYRGKAKGSFWYEPVFQVKTLDGKLVWRRRKYRVKRGKVAGTFYFSVLDNGVVSNESWTIVDVADDLSWGLFHYSGAARVAGQSYTGAVLVSLDGKYPNDSEKDGLLSALGRCYIKEWELFDVDNCSCSGPPLGLPEGSRLHTTINVDNLK
ncbi:violaxanthin de-epoxidase, chloroplastic [Cynara cardunculus var. scolymus]|uniref:violaxanthin de-epoxidase, chloroplastic n=1 Tax=Cynara cardunculus var. scolymus TaxID=59895 RepID=UPI000D62D195|nr:violaxanthin de-epoxidase, chloroplastic [Cynara cardunculus var. scolymus]